ncbi:peroxisome biogenesis protein 22-like [Iris pallida]|uniref:Peroxisome biogenesis protein 22-like n=1 Tax=Iris pallida TaxID=29817 RepID=A0AAX6HYL6_IRIPA|nr:peroxisome biogenesis protein 22-like [Iris pallida]
MSDHITDQVGSLVRRLARTLNRRISDVLLLLFNHRSAGSFGAVAGFAIAVIFTWKFLRSGSPRPPARPKPRVVRTPDVAAAAECIEPVSSSKASHAAEPPIQLDLGQTVRKKLNGARKVTCRLLGVIFEESIPEELQKQATVRPSVLEVLQEISKTCDVYLMERVLDDETEERVLLALEGAGLFHTGALIKDKVLFCSTESGRSSFVRQLEPDLHIDTNLEVVSELAIPTSCFTTCPGANSTKCIYNNKLGTLLCTPLREKEEGSYVVQLS